MDIEGIIGLFEGFAGAINGVWEALKLLNDVLLPDWLEDGETGLLGAAIEGWKRLGIYIGGITEMLNNMESADNLVGDITKLDEAVQKYGKIGTLLSIIHAKESNKVKLEGTIKKLAEKRPYDEMSDSANDAKKDVEDLADEADDPVEVNVDADTESYSSKMKRIREEAKTTTIKSPFDIDTKKADDKIKKTKATAKKPITAKMSFDVDTSAADRARAEVSKPIIVPVTYRATNSPPSGGSSSASSAPSIQTESTPRGVNASYSIASTPITVPAQIAQQPIDIYFNIDGQKIKAVMEKNTIQNIENYLLREGGY